MMALVNFLKFNQDTGAIISDDEFWNVHFRKRLHADNLHPLLSPQMARQWGIQVIYAGVGYPAVHKETVEKTRGDLQKLIETPHSKHFDRVKDVARFAFDRLQNAIRRRIDLKMKFYYGFITEELHQGFFESEGAKVMIQAEPVRENAKKLCERDQKDALLKMVIESKAVVFGYDSDGITGYHLSADNSILGYVHEGFETIGSGKYASGLVFGKDFKAKTLMMRQAGYKPAEGVYELVDSMFVASEHFKEVGGNFNFILVDRKAHDSDHSLMEVFDERARLISELVRIVHAGLISRESAVSFIEALVFKKATLQSIEKKLFNLVKDPAALSLVLRRYKLAEIPFVLKNNDPSNIFIPGMLSGGRS